MIQKLLLENRISLYKLVIKYMKKNNQVDFECLTHNNQEVMSGCYNKNVIFRYGISLQNGTKTNSQILEKY